jgi:leucyl aminopeptidase
MFTQDHLQHTIVERNTLHDATIIPLICLTETSYSDWLKTQNEQVKNWLETRDFKASEGQICYVPNHAGSLAFVVAGLNKEGDARSLLAIAMKLSKGYYELQHPDHTWLTQAVLTFGKAAYRFSKFNASLKHKAKLVWPQDVNREVITAQLHAIYWIRDMINDPTETFSIPQLTDQIKQLAAHFKADFETFEGDELLHNHYPLVHAVGRAGIHAPRFSIVRWGNENHPLLCLVGKGVCYDTGGLSLKNTAGMLLMKKDMGGAAHALGLAYLIMTFNLPVRLMLLIPAVENAMSSNSYRPGDVFIARNGLSVEITNTDAEGRLILADALAQAVENNPNMIIDFATLTGAARVALGPDITAAMSRPSCIADKVQAISASQNDPVATLPLYEPYRKFLKSSIATMTNASSQPNGGAITAGLFLKSFVGEHDWLHLDIPAWSADAIAGSPGAEATGLLSVWAWLQEKYQ